MTKIQNSKQCDPEERTLKFAKEGRQFVKKLKLTVFRCHAEPKGEASGLRSKKLHSSRPRFFASLRYAQNDNCCMPLPIK